MAAKRSALSGFKLPCSFECAVCGAELLLWLVSAHGWSGSLQHGQIARLSTRSQISEEPWLVVDVAERVAQHVEDALMLSGAYTQADSSTRR